METLYSLDEMCKERQREFSNEINRQWLLKQVHAQQPRSVKSCLDRIGNVVIKIGRRVRETANPKEPFYLLSEDR